MFWIFRRSQVVSIVSRFVPESFRPWVVSPLVVSLWVVPPVGCFAPIWWVVSPLSFIKIPRLELGHVWSYIRLFGSSYDIFGLSVNVCVCWRVGGQGKGGGRGGGRRGAGRPSPPKTKTKHTALT